MAWRFKKVGWMMNHVNSKPPFPPGRLFHVSGQFSKLFQKPITPAPALQTALNKAGSSIAEPSSEKFPTVGRDVYLHEKF
jgi:hypothetical protein